jgi:hypothetical protein
MKPAISEFSYGYVVVDAFVRNTTLPIVAAPLFPSLKAEGSTGGGYDVEIGFSEGQLLFLQFKLSDHMVRWSAREARDGVLTPPFYRMHLRPLRISDQHQLLLDLETLGNPVYYTAPKFHRTAELNDVFLSRRAIEQSFFVPPSAIGQLPDDKAHHVAFKEGSPIFIYSEPRRIGRQTDSDIFIGELTTRLRHGGRRADPVGLRETADQMTEIVTRAPLSSTTDRVHRIRELTNRPPSEAVYYLARTWFDCEVLVARTR